MDLTIFLLKCVYKDQGRADNRVEGMVINMRSGGPKILNVKPLLLVYGRLGGRLDRVGLRLMKRLLFVRISCGIGVGKSLEILSVGFTGLDRS